ncbi:MAG: hypothetical protein U0105_08225 [Candidatus Obscuribacterales bacterium]|jgi:hypothetical protein
MSPTQPTPIEQRALEFLRNEPAMRAFVHELLETLGPEGEQWLEKRVLPPEKIASTGNTSFANLIGARQADPDEQKALDLAALYKFFAYRKSLLAHAIPATTVADMLGVSRQTVHDRVRTGQLLGILDNNVLKFPDWQFDHQSPNGVVEGLTDVMKALSCNTFTKISWLSSPNKVFEGLRPVDLLKKGKLDEVIHEAQAVGVT